MRNAPARKIAKENKRILKVQEKAGIVRVVDSIVADYELIKPAIDFAKAKMVPIFNPSNSTKTHTEEGNQFINAKGGNEDELHKFLRYDQTKNQNTLTSLKEFSDKLRPKPVINKRVSFDPEYI